MKKILLILIIFIQVIYSMENAIEAEFKVDCDKGKIEICHKLAKAYYYGDYLNDIAKDREKSVKYLTKACDENYSESCTSLGLLYKSGLSVKKDYKKALKLFKKAYSLDKEAEACFQLGRIYYKGSSKDGITRDRKKSLKYYRLGCDKNNGKSCNNLGILYRDGKYGVTKNYNRALELFEKACDSDDGAEKGCENKKTLNEFIER